MYSSKMPAGNALAMPAMQKTAGNNALAGNFGTGLMQGTIDIKSQYPVWQEQFLNGDTTLQFDEWLKSMGQQNPVMPAGPNRNMIGMDG